MTIAVNIPVITLILFNWTVLFNNAWAPWWGHKNMPCIIYPLRPYSGEKLVIHNTKKKSLGCVQWMFQKLQCLECEEKDIIMGPPGPQILMKEVQL